MLIQFSVANFRSIRERQTLSLVAGNSKELPGNTFPLGRDKLTLLHSVGIYGANASGKSNLIGAMLFAQDFVISSAKDKQRGELIDVEPFRLNSDSINAPSEFEFIFAKDGIRYQYGFSTTGERIIDEYLFVFQSTREQTWFQRAWDADDGAYKWTPFGRNLKGNMAVIKKATRDNALFVSTAVLMNNESLLPIVEWFDKTLDIDSLCNALDYDFEDTFIENPILTNRILQLVQTAGIDITDILAKEKSILVPYSSREERRIETTEVLCFHRHNDHGGKVAFDISEESRGTRTFLAASADILDALDKAQVLVVDEIDSSLHPALVRFIIELFHNPETNPNHAQLIFATHDSSLLDSNLLRQDQIWFTERDAQQSTVLYPLSDFQLREHESLEKGYLHGRYGGLPILGLIGLPKIKPLAGKQEPGAVNDGE